MRAGANVLLKFPFCILPLTALVTVTWKHTSEQPELTDKVQSLGPEYENKPHMLMYHITLYQGKYVQ